MTISTRELVAGNVRAAAARSRISQASLAERLGISQQAVSRRLTGQIDFTVTQLRDLAEFLEVPLERLLAAGDEVPA